MIPEAILFTEVMLFIVYFILTAYRKKIKQYIFGVDFGGDKPSISVSYRLEGSNLNFDGFFVLESFIEQVNEACIVDVELIR